jgi:hypothetical protein
MSLLCCFSIITSFSSIASSEYVSVRLPNDLEISIPNDWEIVSEADLDLAAVCNDEAVNANVASLVVGLIWSLWHLPLFYMIGTSQYESSLPFITFLIIVTSSSFVYTYFYEATKKSLFSAVIYHWINTYILQVISTTVTRSSLYNWLEFIPSLLIGVFFACLLHRKERNRSESQLRYLSR